MRTAGQRLLAAAKEMRQILHHLMNPGLAAQERQNRADAEMDAHFAALHKARCEIAAAGFLPWVNPFRPSPETSPYRYAEVIITRLNGVSWDRKCNVWIIATLPPWVHIGNVYWKPVEQADAPVYAEFEELPPRLLLN